MSSYTHLEEVSGGVMAILCHMTCLLNSDSVSGFACQGILILCGGRGVGRERKKVRGRRETGRGGRNTCKCTYMHVLSSNTQKRKVQDRKRTIHTYTKPNR